MSRCRIAYVARTHATIESMTHARSSRHARTRDRARQRDSSSRPDGGELFLFVESGRKHCKALLWNGTVRSRNCGATTAAIGAARRAQRFVPRTAACAPSTMLGGLLDGQWCHGDQTVRDHVSARFDLCRGGAVVAPRTANTRIDAHVAKPTIVGNHDVGGNEHGRRPLVPRSRFVILDSRPQPDVRDHPGDANRRWVRSEIVRVAHRIGLEAHARVTRIRGLAAHDAERASREAPCELH
jgi:hypothetical protein